jgi:hypothetical protein
MSRSPNRSAVSLDVIDVAKPCPADWNEMRGDAQVRFCKHCSLHVYNLSSMSRADAERLVFEAEGRLCVRFFRRADGTVVTEDCGGGWRFAARKLGRFATTASGIVLAAVLAPLGLSKSLHAAPSNANPTSTPPTVCEPPVPAHAIMGDFVAPPVVMGRFKAPSSQPVAIMGEIAPSQVPATQPAPTPSTPAQSR